MFKIAKTLFTAVAAASAIQLSADADSNNKNKIFQVVAKHSADNRGPSIMSIHSDKTVGDLQAKVAKFFYVDKTNPSAHTDAQKTAEAAKIAPRVVLKNGSDVIDSSARVGDVPCLQRRPSSITIEAELLDELQEIAAGASQ